MTGPGIQHAKTGSQACRCHCEAEFRPAHHKPNDTSSKWNLKHWWEAPTGSGSRARAASSMMSTHDQLQSPTHSDLTYEGTLSYFHRDDGLESISVNTSSFLKGIVPERIHDSSKEQPLKTSTSSRLEDSSAARGLIDNENAETKSDPSNSKEQASRWTDDNGNMVIQNDVFDAILPSVDEVGLQRRISELRIALRASQSARLESEMETEALRKYLTEVEAAAAGLQSRVQELEHIVTFSAKDETRELDQLRAKIVTEVSKEARCQTARAAKAVVAAREATMELDKVRRHTFSLIKSQEEEAERLRMEATECRTIYEARVGELLERKEQIEKFEKILKSSVPTEAFKASQEEVLTLQRCLEAAKIEGQEKSKQFTELLEAFDIQTKTLQSAENRLKDLEREKTDLSNHNEWLEQQLSNLQSHGMAAADHDHELQKARAMLGAEKQHLLSELTMLRRGNQDLQMELVEWQEKFLTLSERVSSPFSFPAPTKGMDALSTADTIDYHSKAEAQEGVDHLECSRGTSDLKIQHYLTPTRKGNARRSSSVCSWQNRSMYQNVNHILNAHCSSHSKEPGRKACGLKERHTRGNGYHQMSCNLFKDDLLAAAHREIVKLKEINQCLLETCNSKKGCRKSHPEKENFPTM